LGPGSKKVKRIFNGGGRKKKRREKGDVTRKRHPGKRKSKNRSLKPEHGKRKVEVGNDKTGTIREKAN